MGRFLFRTIAIPNALAIILMFALYVALLHIFGGGITVFYRGIGIISASFIAVSLGCLVINKSLFCKYFQVIITATLFVYAVHITLPVTIDRSISVQILGTLAQTGTSTTQDLNQKFLSGYVDGYSATCRRIEEQVKSGNIVYQGGLATITNRGRFVQKVFVLLADIFSIEDHYATGDQSIEYAFHKDFNGKECIAK